MDKDLLPNALGSALAGIITRILTHPLDTAKARMQASHAPNVKPYTGTLDVLRRTFRGEGLVGLYRGFGAVIVGGTPGTILYLCSYDLIKKKMGTIVSSDDSFNGHQFLIHFCSGMLAEAVTCVIYVPVDVIKERLQVQRNLDNHNMKNVYTSSSGGNVTTGQYKGSFDALQKIIKYEGFRGIYKGYAATLGSFGPFSAFYFLFYEEAKKYAAQYTSSSNHGNVIEQGAQLPLLYLIACSASSGALASWITSPLDLAKLRLQVQRGALASSRDQPIGNVQNKSPAIVYNGMIDCLKHVYNQNGVRGLFRGSMARVIHFAPATTISMTCYEKCRSFFSNN